MQSCAEYLLHLVRCAIHKTTPSELSDGAFFDSVYSLAVRHDIANIAYYSVEKLRYKPEGELLRKWRGHRDMAIVRDVNQSFARDELAKALADAGIRCVEVQGTRIKPLYPSPEYRTMSDIDLIVPKDELGAAKTVLEELGYSCSFFRDYDLNGEREPDIHVEVHTSYFAKDTDFCGVLGDPFANDGWASRDVLYIYNVLHTAKHYRFAGCGIRRILDLYYLNREYSDVAEKAETKALFRRLGVEDLVRDASLIAECWFGDGGELPEDLREMAEVIIHAGVHGTISRKQSAELERSGSSKKAYVLRRMFPGRRMLEGSYPVLKKAPVLLPFCTVHRWMRAMVKKPASVRREIKKIRDTKTR